MKTRIEYKSFGLKTFNDSLAIVVSPIQINSTQSTEYYKILTKIHFTCGRYGKHIYTNEKTNNYIYKEITQDEYWEKG